MEQSWKNIVFCDFDGTITAIETFVGMLKTFAPELSAQIMPQLYERKLTLREGVRTILESIPSSCYGDVLTYAQDKPIRPGLPELLDFLDSKNIPFVVISGGVKGMVETVLERHGLLKRVEGIWAVEIDTSQDYFQVHSPVEGETELVAKVEVMANYSAEKTIAIGDSVTDINMALKADLVFARDRLIDYMKIENKSYIPWTDFFDIKDYLVKHL
ncbi:HAD-superfamily hydrolase, subfamily IB (PSPase-like) [Gloeothece citriformis PCC 7424]|uniref:HAD-superfamily hydrolase, subfamily IB (PSPase-like) n=1 Tax=Gloeothece citriformis (strain PCC 7424) TaxID=65393 RepID=B7KAV2_GLOC7|nr:HAD-IB family phosphatase [Gloeothece citriformis]ACK68774.1 HAD-superfamily hydrolase, subfamily IB (PSPase-like) [Gloeothece citriformis PCC 7424]